MIWVVANIRTGSEPAVMDELSKGFEILKLQYRARVDHARKIEWKLKAVFPGYGFVKSPLERIHEIRAVPEVYRVLSSPTGPLRVPEAVISEQRARIGPDGLVALSEPVRPQKRRVLSNSDALTRFWEILEADGRVETRAWLSNGMKICYDRNPGAVLQSRAWPGLSHKGQAS